MGAAPWALLGLVLALQFCATPVASQAGLDGGGADLVPSKALAPGDPSAKLCDAVGVCLHVAIPDEEGHEGFAAGANLTDAEGRSDTGASLFVNPFAPRKEEWAGFDVSAANRSIHARPLAWDPKVLRLPVIESVQEPAEGALGSLLQTYTRPPEDPLSRDRSEAPGPSESVGSGAASSPNAPAPGGDEATTAFDAGGAGMEGAAASVAAQEPGAESFDDAPGPGPSRLGPASAIETTWEGPSAAWAAAVVLAGIGGLALLARLSLLALLRFSSRVRRDDALHHPTRARLFATLQDRPWLSEAELRHSMGLRRSTLRHHLFVLVRARLVGVHDADVPRFATSTVAQAGYRCARLRAIQDAVGTGRARLSEVLRVLMSSRGYSRSGAWKLVRRASREGALALERSGKNVWVRIPGPAPTTVCRPF